MDFCATTPSHEVRRRFRHAPLKDVVSQNHAYQVVLCKVFGQRKGGGDASLAFLIGVVEVLQTKFFAVPQEPEKVTGAVASLDDQDLLDPGIHERLDGVIDHWPGRVNAIRTR